VLLHWCHSVVFQSEKAKGEGGGRVYVQRCMRELACSRHTLIYSRQNGRLKERQTFVIKFHMHINMVLIPLIIHCNFIATPFYMERRSIFLWFFFIWRTRETRTTMCRDVARQ
jgi:hypothetical protein